MMVAEQLPSVLIAFAGEVEVALEVEALVEVLEPVGGVDEVELGVAEPGPLRYQFACGSPKQSPTVTDLNPLAYMDART